MTDKKIEGLYKAPETPTQLACLRWPNVGIGWQRRRWNSNVGPTLGQRKLIVG